LNCLPDAYTGPSGAPSLRRDNLLTPPLGCPRHGPGEEYRAQHYYVKITNIYTNDMDVMFRAAQSTQFSPITLNGAQAVVDSTGKGSDVLRRISARVSTSPDASGQVGSDLVGPATALRTADTVCKRIRQLVTNTIEPGDSDQSCRYGITP
jgi:hypothetical protein